MDDEITSDEWAHLQTAAALGCAGWLPAEQDEVRQTLRKLSALRARVEAVETPAPPVKAEEACFNRVAPSGGDSAHPVARPLEEWHEDYGEALWWTFPVREAPYVGSPLMDDWPERHTHWTPFVVPTQGRASAQPVAKDSPRAIVDGDTAAQEHGSPPRFGVARAASAEERETASANAPMDDAQSAGTSGTPGATVGSIPTTGAKSSPGEENREGAAGETRTDEELSDIFSEAYESKVLSETLPDGRPCRVEGVPCDEAGYRAIHDDGIAIGEARMREAYLAAESKHANEAAKRHHAERRAEAADVELVELRGKLIETEAERDALIKASHCECCGRKLTETSCARCNNDE